MHHFIPINQSENKEDRTTLPIISHFQKEKLISMVIQS